MAMRQESSIEIDRPIDEVFSLTNDHVAEWSIVVVAEEIVEEAPGGVGTTFRSITEDHGHRMVFQGTVTRHEPPHWNAVELIGDQFDIAAEYHFEDLGGRTRVTQHSTVEGKGIYKLFFMLFGWAMKKSSCKALEKELQSLKQFCETQPANAAS